MRFLLLPVHFASIMQCWINEGNALCKLNICYFISENQHSYRAKQTIDDMQTNVGVLQTLFFLMFVHRINNYFIYKYNSQKRQTEDDSWFSGIFHRLVF